VLEDGDGGPHGGMSQPRLRVLPVHDPVQGLDRLGAAQQQHLDCA
jgi:hypothetical protein